MDEASLSRRLGALVPPDLDGARERAKLAARVGRAGSPAAHSRHGALRARPIAIVVLLCAALLAAGFFTPPGQAVARWVGERLGLGDPGGPPTLRRLRAGWTKGTGAEGQPAYVLLRGPAPREDRYEFITYRSRREAGARCYELDITKARMSGSAGCGVLPKGSDLTIAGAGGNSQPGEELHYVSGRTSDRVHSVQVELNGRRIPTELVPVPAELIERFGIPRPFKFFIAFIHNAQNGGSVEVTARDGSGRPLDREGLEMPDFGASLLG